jgi:hypothetical protein
LWSVKVYSGIKKNFNYQKRETRREGKGKEGKKVKEKGRKSSI